jgi:hypothetical protein
VNRTVFRKTGDPSYIEPLVREADGLASKGPLGLLRPNCLLLHKMAKRVRHMGINAWLMGYKSINHTTKLSWSPCLSKIMCNKCTVRFKN